LILIYFQFHHIHIKETAVIDLLRNTHWVFPIWEFRTKINTLEFEGRSCDILLAKFSFARNWRLLQLTYFVFPVQFI